MKQLLLFVFLLTTTFLFAQPPAEKYPVDSASVEHAGVPKGEVLKFTFSESKIFPGTTRDYWIYIPKQYKPEQPAWVLYGYSFTVFRVKLKTDERKNAGPI